MIDFITLETERLQLKGFTPSDMKYVFANLPKAEIMTLLGHRSEEEFQSEQRKNEQGYASYNRTFLLFLLIDKSSQRVIGRCGLHNWNVDHRRAEIGYVMSDESFRRKGLMSEAVSAVIAHGFNQLGLNRIEALVGAENTPSLRILEAHDFIREGVMKQHYFIDNTFVDSVVYARLLADYKNDMELMA